MTSLDVGPLSGVELRSHDDGRLEVISAPRHAEFSMSLLGLPDLQVTVDDLGQLVLPGRVTYRPVGFRRHPAGHLALICERTR